MDAAERVRDRLARATAALAQAGVKYAVVGGNAVAEWVGRVDSTAVRTTRDVDLLIQRGEFDVVRAALTAAGFHYHQTPGVDMFHDGPQASPRDALHIVFAGEKVMDDHPTVAPAVTDAEPAARFEVISLEGLVRMKLNSFRDKDRTHLRDLIDVGLIDQSWTSRLPEALADRLQQLVDTPGG